MQSYEGAPFGCSPDGLVGDDGGLEAKAPNPETHLLWLSGGIIPVKHMPQVQFCLICHRPQMARLDELFVAIP